MTDYMDNKALQINGNDSLVLFGSCFSDNIYKKLRADKMKVLSNPFGVPLYPSDIIAPSLTIMQPTFLRFAQDN